MSLRPECPAPRGAGLWPRSFFWLGIGEMERGTRVELATSTLARWRSTTELPPHGVFRIGC